MNFTFNIFLVIFSLGAIQGLIVGALILVKRPQKTYNYYFGLLLLIFSLGSLKIIFQETIPDFLSIFRFPLIYKFASGPLLYLFIKELLSRKTSTFRRIAPHFIPVLLIDVLYRSGFWLFGFRNSDHVIQLINFSTDILATMSYIIYALLAAKEWIHQTSKISEKPTMLQRRNLFWTNKLILVDILSTISIIFYIALTIFNEGYLWGSIRTYYIPYVAVTLYIYFLCYMSYCLPTIEILSPGQKETRRIFHQEQRQEQYLISQRVKQGEFYTDPDLDIHKLATILEIPSRELSRSINIGLGKNFNDFVNELRVEHFNSMFLSGKAIDLSIEGMAYESGFKSKASFYRAYKKAIGLTPLQYQKELTKKIVK